MSNKEHCECYKTLRKRRDGRYICNNCNKIFTVVKYIEKALTK